MLVLTRKQNERIRIGDQITITVLRMKGKAVRLGIQAPADLSVIRGELAFEIVDKHEPSAVSQEKEQRESGSPTSSVPCQAGNESNWPTGSSPKDTAPISPRNASVCPTYSSPYAWSI